MNIITDPGIITVPGDVWDKVIEFYNNQLGLSSLSDDKTVATWQQGAFELKLIKNSTKSFTGSQNIYAGVPYQFQGDLDIDVIPLYTGHQGSTSSYTITLHHIQLTTELFIQGKTVVKFGVIYNPPY